MSNCKLGSVKKHDYKDDLPKQLGTGITFHGKEI